MSERKGVTRLRRPNLRALNLRAIRNEGPKKFNTDADRFGETCVQGPTWSGGTQGEGPILRPWRDEGRADPDQG